MNLACNPNKHKDHFCCLKDNLKLTKLTIRCLKDSKSDPCVWWDEPYQGHVPANRWHYFHAKAHNNPSLADVTAVTHVTHWQLLRFFVGQIPPKINATCWQVNELDWLVSQLQQSEKRVFVGHWLVMTKYLSNFTVSALPKATYHGMVTNHAIK
jgi:hypothetical protein